MAFCMIPGIFIGIRGYKRFNPHYEIDGGEEDVEGDEDEDDDSDDGVSEEPLSPAQDLPKKRVRLSVDSSVDKATAKATPAKKPKVDAPAVSQGTPQSAATKAVATNGTPAKSLPTTAKTPPPSAGAPAGEESKSAKKKRKQQEKALAKEKAAEAAAAVPESPAKPVTPRKAETPLKRQLPNGLQIEELRLGTGKVAEPGKMVSVKYVGKLLSGKKFDESGNKPFTFRLGTGSVIRGWDDGVRGMRIGGRRRLVIPPALAYGKQGSPPVIPGNSTLDFEVELVSA